MENEMIERMLIRVKRGEKCFFPYLVDHLLDVLVSELEPFPDQEDLMMIGLLSLLNAIKLYDKERHGNGCAYIQKYIHLTLLVHHENKTKMAPIGIEIQFPTLGIVITPIEFQGYLDKITEKLTVHKQTKMMIKKG